MVVITVAKCITLDNKSQYNLILGCVIISLLYQAPHNKGKRGESGAVVRSHSMTSYSLCASSDRRDRRRES